MYFRFDVSPPPDVLLCPVPEVVDTLVAAQVAQPVHWKWLFDSIVAWSLLEPSPYAICATSDPAAPSMGGAAEEMDDGLDDARAVPTMAARPDLPRAASAPPVLAAVH